MERGFYIKGDSNLVQVEAGTVTGNQTTALYPEFF